MRRAAIQWPFIMFHKHPASGGNSLTDVYHQDHPPIGWAHIPFLALAAYRLAPEKSYAEQSRRKLLNIS